MNILLTLNHVNGIDSFSQFMTIGIPIVIIISIILMLYFSPAQVLARAIKELGKKEDKKMHIIEENEKYFKLDSGVKVFKNWYNKDNDCFLCEYGTYIPIYNYDDKIIAFMFMRK